MTYLPYNKKEQNTTVGMPSLAATESVDGESTSSSDNEISLSEDIYAFIIVCPVTNISFIFALYVIVLKYTIYGILFHGIVYEHMSKSDTIVQAVKLLLIPVAVSMQEDLMHVYESTANLMYDDKVLEISKSATRGKLIFGTVLRWIDGFASLAVNFIVMLVTTEILGVFLNFAALHFLQNIDDVFFHLVKKGFCGDVMEMMSDLCQRVAFPRRVSNNGCAKELDTILFALTLLICFAIYGIVTWQTFK